MPRQLCFRGRQLAAVELCDYDLYVEPELVDFAGNDLIYMDASGAAAIISFEQ